jgi:hypothetical protein
MTVRRVKVSPKAKQLANVLKTVCNLRTQQEVVEQALILLAYAASEHSKGRVLASVNEKKQTYRTVQTPALTAALGFKKRKMN